MDTLTTAIGRHYATGKTIRVRISGSTIVQIEPIQTSERLPWIGPGLVDCQVNGYHGLDFNEEPLTADAITAAVHEFWKDGVTAVMPTIVTHSFGKTVELAGSWNLFNVPELVRSSIIGLHLEGPFISPEEGPKGAHDARWIGEPREDLIDRCQEASGGLLRLITISPHWRGTADFIDAMVEQGLVVAIGHTAADEPQIRRAVDHGATLSTHLGNGTHTVLPRHPNYVWDQLADDRLWASVIGDGFHLPWNVLKVILRVKQNRVYLVSDAVALAGCKPGPYSTAVGGSVYLHESGKITLGGPESAVLAGSATSLKDAVARMVYHGIDQLGTVWDMASRWPSRFWQRAAGAGLTVGSPADFVLFEYDHGIINICETVKNGRLVYNASSQ